ncbi:RidA family protein [Komagataeibacter medellinensis]
MLLDPRLGKIDFDWMMKTYTRFYGTATQLNLSVRSAFGVVAG